MRRTSLALVLLALMAVPVEAYAQSAADRATARTLAQDGLRLKDEKRFAEALDRFQRAQSLFDAPPHLLFIGECQAALGQLVEAAETYRALGRVQLAPNAPEAFRDAQNKGASQLAALLPRIPNLRIRIEPAGVAELALTLDGAAYSTALVDVDRPTNPGRHKVQVEAPGYDPASQEFQLAEGEKKAVTLQLRKEGAQPLPAAPPATPESPPATPTQPTPATPTQPPPADGARDAGVTPGPAPAGDSPSLFGMHLGLRGGVLLTGGKTGADETGTSESTSAIYTNGGGGEADVGLRLFHHALLYGWYGMGLLGKGGAFAQSPAEGSRSTSVGHTTVGVGLQGATSQRNEDGIGVFADVGWMLVDNYILTDEASQPGMSCKAKTTLTGQGFRLGGGANIPVGSSLLLSPMVTVEVGKAATSSVAYTGDGCGDALSTKVDLTKRDTHTAIMMGASIAYVVDFGGR